MYPLPPHCDQAPAGALVGVGVAGLADDFTGVVTGFADDLTGAADDLGGTRVLDAFVDVGLAADVDLADEVGLPAADDDLLPPPLPEPARARILAAACSAATTMYEVGLVVMWLYHVNEEEGDGDMRAYPGKMEASTTWILSVP